MSYPNIWWKKKYDEKKSIETQTISKKKKKNEKKKALRSRCIFFSATRCYALQTDQMEWNWFFSCAVVVVIVYISICMVCSVIVEPNRVYADLLPVFIISWTLRKRKYPAEKGKVSFWKWKKKPTNLCLYTVWLLTSVCVMKNLSAVTKKIKNYEAEREKNWQWMGHSRR